MFRVRTLAGMGTLAGLIAALALAAPWQDTSGVGNPEAVATAADRPADAPVGPATEGVIRWRSGSSVMPRLQPVEVADAISALAVSGPRHIVVQFGTVVTPGQRQALEAAGLTLLRYLSDNAFFAAIDASRLDTAALAAAADLSAAQPIEREWKLHPSLLAGEVFEWMIVAGPKPVEGENEVQPPVTASDNPEVAVYVIFHPDVDLDQAVGLARLYGAAIRSKLRSINGLVLELPYQNIFALVDEDAVQWCEPPLPKLVELNNDNRARTGADIVQDLPYGLDGSGVTVLVYDGGYASASHSDFGGRLTVRDSSGLSDHATHVSGTVGGDGSASGGTYRGMAPGVTIESYGFEQEGGLQEGFLYTDPGDIEDDYSEAISVYGADISNNSIGTNTASNGFPCEWEGNYGATGVLIDTIVRGDGSNPLFTEPFRIVWANGNERQTSRCLGVEGFPSPYHSTAPPACAKNHITVGAMNSNDDSVTYFTSFGPADDGRMKPDISGPGCQSNDDNGVTSCSSYGGYTVKCGTSMSSPTVCGLGALLLQDFRQQYPGEPDFRNSTLKVLLAHTAEDIEQPGPDYQTGYGSVRIQPAVDLLRAGNFLEAEIDQGEMFSVLVVADPGETEVKITLAWDDVPGTPNVDPVLVNDLDLRVFDSLNIQYNPWTLDMYNPAADAVQTQANHVDNIEQVVIADAAPGAYRIEIYGFNVPNGPQPFSLAATPLLVACSLQGVVSLDRAKYACTSTATVQVIDCDLNTDDNQVETVDVTIVSDTEAAGETLTLTETGPETAAFRGSIELNETGGTGVLQITDGDSVTVTYVDADDGQGGTNVEVTDQAVVDCTPPIISNVQTADIGPREATVTFDTDEPANCVVHYGLSCDALTESVSESGYQTAHTIMLQGLTDETTYFFVIDAEDEAGNAVTDDNGGVCYMFVTPDIPNFFTEEFSGDNDLDYLTLLFTPNGSVDYYAGCVEEITELPTDPAGGTPISLGEDSYQYVSLTGGETVWLYGVSYSGFYICDNGYLTFTTGDTDHTESLADHFDTPRISALFDDLTASGGTVSWKQLDDRAVVTYENVPEYYSSNSNTFQVELHFNGDLQISYLGLDAGDGLAGLSEGLGLDPDYYASDLSAMGSCGPRPPAAEGANLSTPVNTPVNIVLAASDDGLPDPPAALTYVIGSLPQHGTLSDPAAGQIDSVPYTLANGGNQVLYTPDVWYFGDDSFTFKVNDGGVPPEGGDSNDATIFIQVAPPDPELAYAFSLDTDPGWSTEGQWEFGQPTGGGSHRRDPVAGHTGDNVYGYNLAGDYPADMPACEYLTTTAINCSELLATELRFWRWLGVESSNFDHASIEVSSDGSSWTTVWANPPISISDGSWTQMTVDISAVADAQPAVYVRWGMGPTDNVVTYPGWNIDDIEIWAAVSIPQCPGDLNGDGNVDLSDLSQMLAHYGMTEGVEYSDGDIDLDGDVDLSDLSALLAVYGTTCE